MKIRAAGDKGIVVAVCTSERKSSRKKPVARVELREDHGVVGDAHAGDGHRQVSLLARESIRNMQKKGFIFSAGDCAENITTEGIDLLSLGAGSIFAIGDVLLEVTQVGKECDTPCVIFSQAGECIMPKEGIFTKVSKGGVVRPGDIIQVLTRVKTR